MWHEDVAALMDAAKDPVTALSEIETDLNPRVFSDDPRESVAAALLIGMVRDLRAYHNAYEETVEKTYGVPWTDQFEIIRDQVLEPWARIVRKLKPGAPELDALVALRDLVHTERTLTKIRRVD